MKDLAAALHALADVVAKIAERSEPPSAPPPAESDRYYERKTSPLDATDWDRAAGVGFPVFKTGRRFLARASDVHAYLERAPAERRQTRLSPVERTDEGPIPFRSRRQ